MKHLRDGLQQQHDLLVEKIAFFRKTSAHESDQAKKALLEKQIKEAEKELYKVDWRLFFVKYKVIIATCGLATMLLLGGIYVYYPPHKEEPKSGSVTNQIQQTVQDHATGHIYTGTVYITNTKGVSDETFQRLAEELGVTKAALKSFFKILEEKQVPAEDLDRTLREIAVRYKDLLEKVKLLESDDPEVQNLKMQAQQALENGEFGKAEELLNEASAKDVAAAKQLQAVAEKRLLSAAEAKARNGELKFTQLAYVHSAAYYQEAMALLPKDHDETFALYSNEAGYALYLAGQYAQAALLFEQALTIYEKVVGPEHPFVAASLNNLATLYRVQGKYAQAEPLYLRALGIAEKVLGKEHPNVATSLNNLALLYKAQRKYAQAEPLFRRALAIQEKVLGPEYPDVAASLNNLAALYYAQGQYAQAEPLFRRALAIREKVLGPEHPDVAGSLNNFAELYRAQGQYAQAEPLYRRALAIDEKILGKDHPDMAIDLNNLALLYYAQGKYEQAKPLFERALTIAKNVFPSDHPNVRLYSKNYADLLSKLAAAAGATPAPTPP